MSSPPAALLSLRDADAGYGDTTVLRGITLDVPAAGVLAVLGPNGAGKTTLLRAISGQIRLSRGRITFAGADIGTCSPSQRVRLGLCHIPDPRGIFPSLTVRDNLILQAPRRAIGASVERAVATFPKLRTRLGQVAGTLSGGEQQMLAVARAYVQSPRLVLLDEVSMGLAPNVVDEIFGFLDRLRADGTALVLVEQFVHRALTIADEVAVIARGRTVATGPAGSFTEETIFDAYAGTASRQEALR